VLVLKERSNLAVEQFVRFGEGTPWVQQESLELRVADFIPDPHQSRVQSAVRQVLAEHGAPPATEQVTKFAVTVRVEPSLPHEPTPGQIGRDYVAADAMLVFHGRPRSDPEVVVYAQVPIDVRVLPHGQTTGTQAAEVLACKTRSADVAIVMDRNTIPGDNEVSRFTSAPRLGGAAHSSHPVKFWFMLSNGRDEQTTVRFTKEVRFDQPPEVAFRRLVVEGTHAYRQSLFEAMRHLHHRPTFGCFRENLRVADSGQPRTSMKMNPVHRNVACTRSSGPIYNSVSRGRSEKSNTVLPARIEGSSARVWRDGAGVDPKSRIAAV